MEIEIEKMFSTAFLERNKLQEDEYPDKHGLPMCKKCKTERYCVVGEGSDKKIFRVRCKCQQEELERQQEAELKKLLKENDEALKKHQEECETSKRDRDNTHEYFLEKIKAKALEKMKDVTD